MFIAIFKKFHQISFILFCFYVIVLFCSFVINSPVLKGFSRMSVHNLGEFLCLIRDPNLEEPTPDRIRLFPGDHVRDVDEPQLRPSAAVRTPKGYSGGPGCRYERNAMRSRRWGVYIVLCPTKTEWLGSQRSIRRSQTVNPFVSFSVHQFIGSSS